MCRNAGFKKCKEVAYDQLGKTWRPTKVVRVSTGFPSWSKNIYIYCTCNFIIKSIPILASAKGWRQYRPRAPPRATPQVGKSSSGCWLGSIGLLGRWLTPDWHHKAGLGLASIWINLKWGAPNMFFKGLKKRVWGPPTGTSDLETNPYIYIMANFLQTNHRLDVKHGLLNVFPRLQMDSSGITCWARWVEKITAGRMTTYLLAKMFHILGPKPPNQTSCGFLWVRP